MERKRVAGRFAAEDKGGVAQKRAAPRAKNGSTQQATVLMKLGEPDQKEVPQKPKGRGKSLIGLLLESWKKALARESAKEAAIEGLTPIHTDDTN